MQITFPFVIGIIIVGCVLLGVACTLSWRILGRHLGRKKAVDPEDQLTAMPKPRRSVSHRRKQVESIRRAKLEMDQSRRNGNTPSLPQSRFVSPLPYPALKAPAGLHDGLSINPSESVLNPFNILQPASIYSSSVDKASKDQCEVINEVTPETYNKPCILRRSRHSACLTFCCTDVAMNTAKGPSLLKPTAPAYSPGAKYPELNSFEPSSSPSPHFPSTAESTIDL